MIGLLMMLGLVVGDVSGEDRKIKVKSYANTQYQYYNHPENNKVTKHGWFKSFYEDETYQAVGNYKDGFKVGKWIQYHSNGQIEYEKNYKNGVKDGEWIENYKNGSIKTRGYYKDGKKDSLWVDFYFNGVKRFLGDVTCDDDCIRNQGNYKNDERTGTWVAYDPKGNKLSEGIYGVSGDTWDGKFIGFWDNNKIMYIANYKKGEKEGEYLSYSSGSWTSTYEETLDTKSIYKNGKCIPESSFYSKRWTTPQGEQRGSRVAGCR
jgi:antitoxin component YwqK of YwqJK toxin-antitoxin module